MAPMEVPTRCAISSPASRIAFQAPAQARDLAPPPPKTATTLTPTATPAPIADCGMRIAESQGERRTAPPPPPSIPQSTIRNPQLMSLSRSRRVPAIHHPGCAPLGRAVEAPLLVGGLGHNRRDRGRHARVVEGDVGDVARVGVVLLAREHVLGDDLHAHLHRRPPRVV